MKLHIATDEGEIIDSIDGLEEYDLSKNMARVGLISQIQIAIDMYRRRLEREAAEKIAANE